MSNRTSNISKAMLNLPSNLSEFTWIENTEINQKLLDEKRQKQLDIKKLKDIERKQKLSEVNGLLGREDSTYFSIQPSSIQAVPNEF